MLTCSIRFTVDSKVSEVTNADLKGVIDRALASVQQHPDHAHAGLAVAPARVDIGCPGPARMLMPGFDHDDGVATGSRANVAAPSLYRTFVFIAPRQAATRPNGSITHIVPQEYMCDGDKCREVTTALYLAPADLGNGDSLQKLFTSAVGLDPDPTTPEPWK